MMHWDRLLSSADEPMYCTTPASPLYLSIVTQKQIISAEAECLHLWSAELWDAPYQRHSTQSARRFVLDVGGYRLDVAQSPHQLLQPGVTGSVVWDGGVMLCRCLEHWVDGNLLRLRGARVIDLGSGTGLVGIAAAALGANAVLTDQACMLRLLRENAARNTEEPLPGVVTVAELDWDDPQHSAAHREPTPLVVMAADCVFNEAIVPALLQTMAALAGPETLLLISLELRSDETHQVFLSLALAGFRVWRLLDSCLPPAMVCARAKVYVLTVRADEGVAAAGRGS